MGDFERVNFEIDIMRRILFSSLFMREYEPVRLKIVNTRRLVVIDTREYKDNTEERFREPLFYMYQKCEKLALVCKFFNRIRVDLRDRIVIRHTLDESGPLDIVTQADWLAALQTYCLYNFTIHYKVPRVTRPDSIRRVIYRANRHGDPPSDYVFEVYRYFSRRK